MSTNPGNVYYLYGMIYVILGIVVVVALFLIFWDDHDKSYNKKEKGAAKAPKAQFNSGPKAAPKIEKPKAEKKASGPTLKEQILLDIDAAIQEVKKGMEEPMSMARKAMDVAKEAIDNAVKEAQQGWSTSDNSDVDEQQEQED